MKPICVAQQTENANKQKGNNGGRTQDAGDKGRTTHEAGHWPGTGTGSGNAHNLNNYFDFNAGARSRPVASAADTNARTIKINFSGHGKCVNCKNHYHIIFSGFSPAFSAFRALSFRLALGKSIAQMVIVLAPEKSGSKTPKRKT